MNIQFRVSLRLPIICPEREQGRHGRQGEKREHRLVFTYFQYFSTGTFLKCYSPMRNNTDQWKHNFNLRLNQCSMTKSFKYWAVIKQSQIKKIKSFAGNHPHHKLPNCSLSPTPDFSSHSCYPIRTHEVWNQRETIRTLMLPTCCTLHGHGQESSGQLPVSDESRINIIPYTSGRGCNYRLGKHSSKISILSQCSKCLYFDLCCTSENEGRYFKLILKTG